MAGGGEMGLRVSSAESENSVDGAGDGMRQQRAVGWARSGHSHEVANDTAPACGKHTHSTSFRSTTSNHLRSAASLSLSCACGFPGHLVKMQILIH